MNKLYGFISILNTHKSIKNIKWSITIALLALSLISCSKSLIFPKKLPEKINYSKISFVECPADISGYLCIKNTDAINSVLDLKNCQEQNKLLRDLLNGN